MKTNKTCLIHYIAQAIGMLCIQIPIFINWISWQPEKTDHIVIYMLFDSVSVLTKGIVLRLHAGTFHDPRVHFFY